MNVLVTESGSYSMQARWQTLLTGMGHTVNMQPVTVLNNNAFFATTNALIVSDGTMSYTSTQIATIQAFLQSGKPVYLQSEYLATYGGNLAFAQIVNALGGSFTWGATQSNDQDPIVAGTFATTNNAVPSLPYFWYGCTGGGSNVFPFLFSTPTNLPLGWSFCPSTGGYGKLITTSDQDWIQNMTSYPASVDLMENIFTHMITPGLCGPSVNPVGTLSSKTDVSCNGGSNGSATVSVSGGTAPYTYSWSPSGGNAATITGRVAGTYTCTIRDALNRQDTVIVNIGQPAALTSTGSQVNASCGTTPDGSATVSVSGGTPSYTYSWSPSGGTSATASNLAAGNYTVNYQDAHGCTGSRSYTITSSGTIAAVLSSANPTTCGGTNGSITLSGLVPGTTYTVNFRKNSVLQAPLMLTAGGSGTIVITGLASATYSSIVANAGSCNSASLGPVTLTDPAAPATPAAGSNSPVCQGSALNLSTAAVTGATYSWTGPAGFSSSQQSPTVNNMQPSQAGTYSVTVTVGGCVSAPGTINVSVSAPVTPSVTVTPAPGTTICAGTNVTFTATPTNGGALPVYQWRKNGVNVGTNSATYADNGLANGDVITVRLTSNATCRTADTVSSSAVTMTVNTSLIPSVSVTASPSGAVCAGTNVTFTATPVNGGATPVYQWRKNGVNVGTNSPTYTDNTLTTADRITVRLTSNAPCRTVDTVNSSQVGITVNAGVTPSVTVAPAPGTTICAGSNVTFTATPANGGTTPVYQWRKNGIAVGTNSATYTDNGLANGDVITVRLTSNATCRTADTVNSAAVTMTVNANLVPSVAVTANPGSSVCAGSSVTFTATPTNGGTTPVYQWRKNGIAVGTNSTTYTDNALANGDVITVRLTSNASCRTTDTVSSNAVTMAVGTNLVPAVTIAANPGSTICTGASVTFTATPTNGGTSPVYQWRKNGIAVGTNSATYSDNGLANGDVITVRLTSNATCRTADTASSSAITMTVGTNLPPSVTVAAAPGSAICAGTNVTFTATPVNGGTTPVYQWRKNGIAVGTNSAVYNDNALVNGDAITVRLTSNASCRAFDTAASAAVTMTVGANVTPSVSIVSGSGSTICAGTNVTFTATPTNGGAAPVYQWRKNGVSVGTNSTTYTDNALANGDVITVRLTSNATCRTADTVSSSAITMTVGTVPAQPGPISGNTLVCGGTAQSYSIAAVTGATGYSWSLPAGWSGSSTAVSLNATAAAVSGTGVISVSAVNGCGPSLPRTLGDTIINTPAVPGTIFGNANVCAGTAQTYSITAVPQAASYTWTMPAGWGAPLPAGTSVSTAAASAAGTGNITVTATNQCGTSSARSLAVTVNTAPATPGPISGNTAVCAGTSQPYSAAAVPQATSYAWTLPAGWSGSDTTGTISAAIGGASGPAVLSLRAMNGCGTSAPRTLTVTVTNTPAMPGAISGSASVCAGTAQPYSIAAVPEATTYTWTIPGTSTGWTSSGALNTTQLSTTAGTQSGVVSVTASNQCGTSAAQTLAVTVIAAPAVPGTISGNANVCAGTAQPYSIAAVPQATTYTWTIPGSGWTATGAAGNTVAGPAPSLASVAGTAGGAITVTASNQCGTSAPRTLTVAVTNIPGTPGTVSGPDSLCAGAGGAFSIGAVNEATSYVWTLPVTGGWTGSSSTTSINAVSGAAAPDGTAVITVAGTNFCGTGPVRTKNVWITRPVTPTVTLSSANPAMCSGRPVTFMATAAGGGTAPLYQWRINGQNSGSPVPGAVFTSTTLNNGDVVSVVLASSAVCAIPPQVTSNSITVQITPTVTPGVNVNASQPAGSLCAGTPVTFTATPIAGAGANPSYQWQKNRVNVGTNSANYTDATLNSSDTVSVIMTSSAVCVTSPTAQSNRMGMRVWPVLSPSVTVTVSPGLAVSQGTVVTFTAQAVNGGTSPGWQWMKNGQAIPGATGASYATSTLRNGDVITVQLRADQVCVAGGGPVVSAPQTVLVSTGGNSVGLSAGVVMVYPNPSSGRFTVQVRGGMAGRQVRLEALSLLGQVVAATAVTPDGADWSTELDLNSAAAGQYLIRLSDPATHQYLYTTKIQIIK